MKFIKFTIFLFLIAFFSKHIFANNTKIYSTYEVNKLNLISYSKSWTKDKLQELYLELLNNFHGDEFDYLKYIYIYPDSPFGVNGHYYDDLYIENGNYKFGNNSYIQLFNGEKYDNPKKIASILSHEYGHHYVIYNLLNSENISYHNLSSSKYIKIRGLEDKPVIYNSNQNNYVYHWDIMEILADDYVQLLGSSTAKLSYDYNSIDEILEENKITSDYVDSFNLKPQLNPYLPLAADVEGLYNYFLEMAGFTVTPPKIPEMPTLSEITISQTLNGELTYNIGWTEAKEDTLFPFEYTLVMYPSNNPFVPIPLKTVYSNEPLNATFGSYSIREKNNSIKSISQVYEGEYVLKLYVKDVKGFLHSSDTLIYNFDKPLNKPEKNNIVNTKHKNNEMLNIDKQASYKKAKIINKGSNPKKPIQTNSLNDIFYLISNGMIK